MAKKFSIAELCSIYKKKGEKEIPNLLNEETIIGNSTDSILTKLEKLLFTREQGEFAKEPLPLIQNTISICLVIVDNLYHEEIWRNWIETNNNNNNSKYKAKLIIHAKYPDNIKSKWVKDRTLLESFIPEWNSPEVIRAMLLIMKEALKDENCGRILFGTETCIPLYPLDYIANKMYEYDMSWLSASHRPCSIWESGACFQSVDQTMIPQRAVWKSLPGWIMLTRKHANEISLLPTVVGGDLVKAWGPGGTWTETNGAVFAPEEIYFPTCLSILGYLRDKKDSSNNINNNNNLFNDEVIRQTVTYAEWKKVGDANPIKFPLFTKEICNKMRSSGSLFGRKFDNESCSYEQWNFVINSIDNNNNNNKIIINNNSSSSYNNYNNNKNYNNHNYSNSSNKDRNDGRYNNRHGRERSRSR